MNWGIWEIAVAWVPQTWVPVLSPSISFCVTWDRVLTSLGHQLLSALVPLRRSFSKTGSGWKGLCKQLSLWMWGAAPHSANTIKNSHSTSVYGTRAWLPGQCVYKGYSAYSSHSVVRGHMASPVIQVNLGEVKKCAQGHRGTEPWNQDAKAGWPPSESLSHMSFLEAASGQ